jgi:hypothetical protein
VTRTTNTLLITEQLPNRNSRKRLALKANVDPEEGVLPSFSNRLIHSIGSQSLKRLHVVRRGKMNPFSILKSMY